VFDGVKQCQKSEEHEVRGKEFPALFSLFSLLFTNPQFASGTMETGRLSIEMPPLGKKSIPPQEKIRIFSTKSVPNLKLHLPSVR
jgi:hypothetical protein